MFAVGDKVVYPMHGAGVIEAIEEHEVLGRRQSYYILAIPRGGMRVMIPLQNVNTVGLRGVIDKTEVDKVVEVLASAPVQTGTSWNRRFNANLAKIKSGSIFQVAEVVRSLTLQDRVKRLSAGERRLLETARHIMVSELVLASGRDPESVESWVEGLVMSTSGN